MKKYFFGIMAIVLALSISAFTSAKHLNSPKTTYYWYTPDGNVSLGSGSFPNNGCTVSGTGCAKGYTNPNANPHTDNPQITVRN